MKTLLRPVTVLMLALPLLLAGMSGAHAELSPEDKASIKEVKKETADLMKTLKSYGAAQRDEAIQDIEVAILRPRANRPAPASGRCKSSASSWRSGTET